jgi:hypothetical protein
MIGICFAITRGCPAAEPVEQLRISAVLREVQDNAESGIVINAHMALPLTPSVPSTESNDTTPLTPVTVIITLFFLYLTGKTM